MSEFLLKIEEVSKIYHLPRKTMLGPSPRRLALDQVSLSLRDEEIFGIVGESGSGKSTLARLITELEQPDQGEIVRRKDCSLQMVFQDPYSSLDPRQRVERIVTEPLHAMSLERTERRKLAAKALVEVGLSEQALDRFPHQFSGGQRQRIAIARALIAEPTLLCADEPVSALDVSIQAQVLNLLLDICAKRKLAMIFISHDLSVVAHMCDRVAIMQRGRIVETGQTVEVLQQPRHPYTRQLRDAVLPADPGQAQAMLGR